MPENHSNSGPENNVTIDSLNEKSESITDSLENFEELLDIQDNETKVSDDLRVAFLKIKSLSRSNDNQILQVNYSKILEQYEKLGERSFSSKSEYSEATSMLLVDLSELHTSKGEKLVDTDIDGGLFEAGIALVDGVVKAGETIYEEIKGYFEMVGMAGELPSILEKVWDSLSMETFLNIYDALVDMGGDIIRDFSLIMDNSSSTGKAVELSNFIPAIGIPILFEAIGPGKFLKILKVDKLIPENVISAMDGAVTKGKEIAGNVVDNGKNMFGDIGKSSLNGMDTQFGFVGNKPKKSVGDINADGYNTNTIRDNFGMSDLERRESAVKVLSEKYGDSFEGFSEKQLDGIMESHEIGKELFEKYLRENGLNSVSELSDKQVRDIFNSKEGRIALRQKMKRLKDVGIDMKYSDDLIRSGITGGLDLGDINSLNKVSKMDAFVNIEWGSFVKDIQIKETELLGKLTTFFDGNQEKATDYLYNTLLKTTKADFDSDVLFMPIGNDTISATKLQKQLSDFSTKLDAGLDRKLKDIAQKKIKGNLDNINTPDELVQQYKKLNLSGSAKSRSDSDIQKILMNLTDEQIKVGEKTMPGLGKALDRIKENELNMAMDNLNSTINVPNPKKVKPDNIATKQNIDSNADKVYSRELRGAMNTQLRDYHFDVTSLNNSMDEVRDFSSATNLNTTLTAELNFIGTQHNQVRADFIKNGWDLKVCDDFFDRQKGKVLEIKDKVGNKIDGYDAAIKRQKDGREFLDNQKTLRQASTPENISKLKGNISELKQNISDSKAALAKYEAANGKGPEFNMSKYDSSMDAQGSYQGKGARKIDEVDHEFKLMKGNIDRQELELRGYENDFKVAKSGVYKYTADTVRNNFGKNKVQRQEAAMKLLKNKHGDDFEGLSISQLDGIIESHEIGQDLFEKYIKENGLKSASELSDKQIREIFNSKEGRIVLRKKMKKLSDSGINEGDASDLIRSGITGGIGDDFALFLKGDYFPTAHKGKGSISNDGNGSVDELFQESLDNIDRITKRSDEINILSSIIKSDIDGLSKGMDLFKGKINDLYLFGTEGATKLSAELNQEYGLILSKFKELDGLKKEFKGLNLEIEKFEVRSSATDVVDKMISMIDFDEGTFNIIENNYKVMGNELQSKLNKYTQTTKKSPIKLEVVDEARSLLDSLLVA